MACPCCNTGKNVCSHDAIAFSLNGSISNLVRNSFSGGGACSNSNYEIDVSLSGNLEPFVFQSYSPPSCVASAPQKSILCVYYFAFNNASACAIGPQEGVIAAEVFVWFYRIANDVFFAPEAAIFSCSAEARAACDGTQGGGIGFWQGGCSPKIGVVDSSGIALIDLSSVPAFDSGGLTFSFNPLP